MAEIRGRPFLEYLLLQLRRHGCSDIVLCTGHLSDQVRQYFGDGARWGTSIRYSEEPEPKGTAGALKLAEPLLVGNRWLVLNGDSLFDAPLQRLLDVHDSVNAAATIALVEVPDVHRYGSVLLGSGTEVVEFEEKGAEHHAGLINAGAYVLDRRLWQEIPSDRAVSLEREVFPQLVGRGLHGIQMDGPFVDIGLPETYQQLLDEPAPLLRLLG